VLYLAYGSNMLTARLTARVPSAREPRVAALPGCEVRYRKLSVDGSAKCDLVRVGGGAVAYGVVFEVDPGDMAGLDRAERAGYGYHRAELTAEVEGGQVQVAAYLADESHVVRGPAPYDWYRDLVVAGAREHGLPEAYVRAQLDVAAVADPDAGRARHERAVLGAAGA
jgi:hypothetical protein